MGWTLSECTGLTTLEVDAGPAYVWNVATLIADNISSLKHLRLGCEKAQALHILEREALEISSDYKSDFMADVKQCVGHVYGDSSLDPIGASSDLQSLHIVGFDPSMLLETSIFATYNMNNLRSLSLESCPGCEAILYRSVASSPKKWMSSLRTFKIRQESVSVVFQKHLKSFLSSFSGLVNLSVLLTGSDIAIDPKCFIKPHGASLKTLVWDQRSRPRKHFAYDEQGLCLRSLEMITAGCPGLQELGVSFLVKENCCWVCHIRSAVLQSKLTRLLDITLSPHC